MKLLRSSDYPPEPVQDGLDESLGCRPVGRGDGRHNQGQPLLWLGGHAEKGGSPPLRNSQGGWGLSFRCVLPRAWVNHSLSLSCSSQARFARRGKQGDYSGALRYVFENILSKLEPHRDRGNENAGWQCIRLTFSIFVTVDI